VAAGKARQPHRDHHDHVQLHRAAVLNYVLVNVMRPTGSMDPATARFPEGAHLPTFRA
jgi:hypothetical protein